MAKNEYPHFNPKTYDMEQQGKDVFQFNVYGNKEQKIGDFTQEKLF